ncbi:UNVERIFIED_CONTAM: hypothetical protein HDU68_010638, partial [Siphonaria sp. JEL0065]
NCSVVATTGSNPDLKNTDPVVRSQTQTSKTKSMRNKSIISLAYEETKRGIGLWGGEGIFGTYGFPIAFDNENPATATSVLKKWMSMVPGGFVPPNLWDSLEKIIAGELSTLIFDNNKSNSEKEGRYPPSETVHKVRHMLQVMLPSKHHLHTLAYIFQHLQRVAAQSDVNLMTPTNLVTCVFIDGGDSAEFLIRYADLIFGNVDLVDKNVVESLPITNGTSNDPDYPPLVDYETDHDYMEKWLQKHLALHK